MQLSIRKVNLLTSQSFAITTVLLSVLYPFCLIYRHCKTASSTNPTLIGSGLHNRRCCLNSCHLLLVLLTIQYMILVLVEKCHISLGSGRATFRNKLFSHKFINTMTIKFLTKPPWKPSILQICINTTIMYCPPQCVQSDLLLTTLC
jgi:hypothetical protein